MPMLDPTRYAPPDELGLTHAERRRFEMAKAALTGLLSRAQTLDCGSPHGYESYWASLAVTQADEILKELGLA